MKRRLVYRPGAPASPQRPTRYFETPSETTSELPILMYHRVAPEGVQALDRFRLTPEGFEAQLRWLREAGYESATLAEWRLACRLRQPLPGRRVILTFDDGYADFHDHAWPLLQRYGFGAHVFLVTGEIGGRSVWDAGYGESAPLLSWDQVRILAAAGVHFGSHGASHRAFPGLTYEELAHELIASRRAIEDATGGPVASLCAPYGMLTPEVEQIAAACGFSELVSTIHRLGSLRDDPMRLPRLEVRSDASLEDFQRMVEAG
jgi:peptidoglycan/xylan/chitin deacetylase (PgdA/CDA1 family)